jgi:hypothetical protein
MASCIGPTLAFADDERMPGCVDASVPKNSVAEHGGNWIALTLGQWQFLHGIYAMNPNTPAGLPTATGRCLHGLTATPMGWCSGDKACTPMLLPHELLGILRDVETGKIAHETAGLALATPAGAAGAHSGA